MKNLSIEKQVLILFFLLFSFYCEGQSDKVVLGTIDSIDSKILKEKRKIWVYVPNGGTIDLYSKQKYPVVYLLDGDAHFYSVVGMIQQLSQVNGNTVCPEMIVVGIPNTDRTRDLTPTHIDIDAPYLDSASAKTSGGGEQFISFIEHELAPFIESKYPTSPYKMLIGHSFGGLTVMQTFVHHTNLFDSYICIDPSMWWDKKKLLEETKMFLSNTKLDGKSFYLGVANTMNEGLDIKSVVKDTTIETRHIRSILELKSALENNMQNGLKYQSKYYGEDSHGSVPLITEYDGLRFIFDFYNLKLTLKDFSDTTGALMDRLEKYSLAVSKGMGYKIYPSEELVNGMGYQALGSKHYNQAASFFKMNVDNFPQSYNVYDSYGDYFLAIKDNVNAIDNFKKALALKENPETRRKLEQLLK